MMIIMDHRHEYNIFRSNRYVRSAVYSANGDCEEKIFMVKYRKNQKIKKTVLRLPNSSNTPSQTGHVSDKNKPDLRRAGLCDRRKCSREVKVHFYKKSLQSSVDRLTVDKTSVARLTVDSIPVSQTRIALDRI